MPTFVSQLAVNLCSDVEIAWPGVPFDPPDGKWVRVNVLWGDAQEWTMGSSSKGGASLVTGVLSLDFFAPAGTGKGDLLDCVDSARTSLSRLISDGIYFGAASAPRPLNERGSEWIGFNVSVPFTLEEIL